MSIATAVTPLNEDEVKRFDLALHYFAHVEGQVGLATNKTGLLIAANAFLIAAYLTLLKDFADLVPKRALHVWYADVGTAFLLLTAATAFSLFAVFPTRRRRYSRPNAGDAKSLLFFGHVASALSTDDYATRFRTATAENLIFDVLEQNHGKACHLNRMFRWLQVSMVLTILSLILFAIAVAGAFAPKLFI
jgi:Family of unknown function (DUF5706)